MQIYQGLIQVSYFLVHVYTLVQKLNFIGRNILPIQLFYCFLEAVEVCHHVFCCVLWCITVIINFIGVDVV